MTLHIGPGSHEVKIKRTMRDLDAMLKRLKIRLEKTEDFPKSDERTAIRVFAELLAED